MRENWKRPGLLIALAVGAALAVALAVDASRSRDAETTPAERLSALVGAARLVDLTHDFSSETLYWPTAPSRFEHKPLDLGEVEGGWFYSAFTFGGPEHGGTHLDAPYHFARQGQDAAEVPLRRLIAPAVVIDVTAQAAADADYSLTRADLRADEKANGRIPEGAIVLLYTGWSKKWPDSGEYFGTETPDSADNLHFPSFGPEAVRWLVEDRGVAAIGVDTASTDIGVSKEFPVHRYTAARNIPGFENLAGLDRLPARGAMLIALPMKIRDGSGGPLRAVAILPEAE